MVTIEVYACYIVKIYKYKPPKNFKQGDTGAPVLGPPLSPGIRVVKSSYQTKNQDKSVIDYTV